MRIVYHCWSGRCFYLQLVTCYSCSMHPNKDREQLLHQFVCTFPIHVYVPTHTHICPIRVWDIPYAYYTHTGCPICIQVAHMHMGQMPTTLISVLMSLSNIISFVQNTHADKFLVILKPPDYMSFKKLLKQGELACHLLFYITMQWIIMKTRGSLRSYALIMDTKQVPLAISLVSLLIPYHYYQIASCTTIYGHFTYVRPILDSYLVSFFTKIIIDKIEPI